MTISPWLLYALLGFLAGLILGLVAGLVFSRNNRDGNSANDRRQLQKELITSKEQLASLQARLSSDREHHQQQIQLLNDARNQLLTEFRASAGQLFEQRQRQFQEDSGRQIGSLLKPLQDQIQNFYGHLENVRSSDARERGSLKRELEQLMELNQQMSSDARNLTDALKGNNKVMGTWGEVVLQRVLESSGLTDGREYKLQREFRGSDDSRLRPDAVVYLPGERHIIIDSKVSLLSYERASNALTADERSAHIKKHIESLKRHILELSSKQYQEIKYLNSPDFVIMFVALESAVSSAMESDPSLFQFAMDRKILIVSPPGLFLSLRIVEQMWKGEKQQKNARQIALKAGALYDKFESFVSDMQKVGDKLQDAKTAWTSASKKLNSGRGNVIRRIEELKELGAETSKHIQSLNTGQDDPE